jgi:enoyl-CoA hydratase
MSEVAVERSGDGVATITLDAPKRRNALTVAMAEELVAACEELDGDASVGAVVVRGAGGFFCAGGDRSTLTEAGRDPAAPETYEAIGAVYRSFARVGELEPPTIAAVRGGAVGAGLNLMLATDLRIVASDARIVSGFLPIGLHPGGGHGALLGRSGAREAAAAAWAAVEDADVEATAHELAARAGADPELARRTAASLRTVLGPPALAWGAALELERSSQMWSMRRKALGAHAAANDRS